MPRSPPLYVILIWAGAGFGAGTFLPPAMQADVIDYDELYTGKRREAQYGALWGIATKFAVIPARVDSARGAGQRSASCLTSRRAKR